MQVLLQVRHHNRRLVRLDLGSRGQRLVKEHSTIDDDVSALSAVGAVLGSRVREHAGVANEIGRSLPFLGVLGDVAKEDWMQIEKQVSTVPKLDLKS